MGVRHYAPRARLVLVEGIRPGLDAALMVEVNRLEEAGEVVGVMAPEGSSGAEADAEEAVRSRDSRWATTRCMFQWGRGRSRRSWRSKLYAGLRWLDAAGATVIVCPLPEPVGIGVAMRDRLVRAGTKEAGNVEQG